MTECPKYSVIVPVYKAEGTLRRCVDSLLNQNYADMELILVNDGSPDGSGTICEEYSNRFDCVVYIEKNNGGVSAARNAGLDRARGKYVLFVDSDDYVADGYFASLDAMCVEKDYDFVMFSFYNVYGKQVKPHIQNPFAAGTSQESVPKFCEALSRKTLNEPWSKRYLRSIITEKGIWFPEDLYVGEDKSFNLMYVMHCESCLISEVPLYYVSLDNPNSLSRGPRPDLYRQLAMMEERTQKTIREARIPEEYRRQYQAAENLIQLRAVYSEAKRMHLAGQKRKYRWKKIHQMCDAITEAKMELPDGAFSILLQIPVRLRMTALIDLMGWKLAN